MNNNVDPLFGDKICMKIMIAVISRNIDKVSGFPYIVLMGIHYKSVENWTIQKHFVKLFSFFIPKVFKKTSELELKAHEKQKLVEM